MEINGYMIEAGAYLRGANLKGASLAEADLTGADLYRADLYRTYLYSADLAGANLSGADLSWATLRGANLYRADLAGTNLYRADLAGASLSGANLRGANLRGANLKRADLAGTNLTGTVLDPRNVVPEIDDEVIKEAGLVISGDQIYGWRTHESIFVGQQVYASGECYEAPYFSTCCETSCHPGIYLAGENTMWEAYPDEVLVRCYCLRSELVHARDKWRAKRLWIV
jgi:hypothetical protein